MTPEPDRPSPGCGAVLLTGGRPGSPELAQLDGRTVIDHVVAVADATCESTVVADAGEHAGLVAAAATAAVELGELDAYAIFDACWPRVEPELVRRLLDAVADGAVAAIAAVAVTDTCRSVDGALVDRETLVSAQSPIVVAGSAMRAIDPADAPDSADIVSAVVEACGGSVVGVEPDRNNLPADLPHRLAALRSAVAS